jgi:hypothetical protein
MSNYTTLRVIDSGAIEFAQVEIKAFINEHEELSDDQKVDLCAAIEDQLESISYQTIQT